MPWEHSPGSEASTVQAPGQRSGNKAQRQGAGGSAHIIILAGLNKTAEVAAGCPASVTCSWPVCVSHPWTCPPVEPASTYLASGVNVGRHLHAWARQAVEGKACCAAESPRPGEAREAAHTHCFVEGAAVLSTPGATGGVRIAALRWPSNASVQPIFIP